MKAAQITIAALLLASIAQASPSAAPALPGAPASSSWQLTPSGQPVAVYQLGADYSKVLTNSSRATNQGGQFLVKATIVVLFWGDFWSSPSGQTAKSVLSNSLTVMTSGAYFSQMGQYGGIQSPSYTNEWIIPGAVPGLDACNDDNAAISQMLLGELKPGGYLGVRGFDTNTSGNVVYLILTPPVGPGGPMPCHYHMSGPNVVYAWVPLFSLSATSFDYAQTTNAMSHEIIESISDFSENGTRGFTLPISGVEDELADGCGETTLLDGVQVRAYWSNEFGACVIPFPGPASIYSFSPPGGPATGGTIVQIFGSGFDMFGGTTQVSIGGVNAPVIGGKCVSFTECDVITPPAANVTTSICNQQSEVAPLKVTTNQGFIANGPNFAYGPPVTLTVQDYICGTSCFPSTLQAQGDALSWVESNCHTNSMSALTCTPGPAGTFTLTPQTPSCNTIGTPAGGGGGTKGNGPGNGGGAISCMAGTGPGTTRACIPPPITKSCPTCNVQ